MLSTGIPELSTAKDLYYLRESLCLHMTDEEATKHFTKLIWKSLNTISTQINFFVHSMAARSKKRKSISENTEPTEETHQ